MKITKEMTQTSPRDVSNLFIGQLKRGGAALCFHSIGCTMGNMNKENLMIYQCIPPFNDDNTITMKPNIYYNKNNIVTLYIETCIQSVQIFDFSWVLICFTVEIF